MKYTVFDTADDCTSKIAALKKAGITAIIRYDDPSQNPNSWKQIGGPEYNAILAAGMAVGIVSEWINNHLGYFNAISGKRDGDYSVHRAQLRNQPKGTAIYSTVDYDAQPSDMTQIKAFFTAFAKSIRGAGYKVGCYGSGYTCNQLLAAKLIDYTWITCSSGFRDSNTVIQQGTYDIWQVFGLCDQIYQGLSIDWDAANPMRNGDWGQIITPKKGRAVARKSKNPKHPAVTREAEDWSKERGR